MRRRVFVALIFGYAVLAHRFCRPPCPLLEPSLWPCSPALTTSSDASFSTAQSIDQPSAGMHLHNNVTTQRYSWRNTASQTTEPRRTPQICQLRGQTPSSGLHRESTICMITRLARHHAVGLGAAGGRHDQRSSRLAAPLPGPLQRSALKQWVRPRQPRRTPQPQLPSSLIVYYAHDAHISLLCLSAEAPNVHDSS